MSSLLIIYLIIIIMLVSSLKVVREYERISVFRLGHFYKIVGPGIVFTIPICDKAVKLNLNKTIPEWQSLSNDDLLIKIKKHVLSETN
jgi:regulator of protease activity HflC (stomatin/prohibitin superfamily)